MSETADFGYSKVEWEKVNPDNVKLVESEYRQRFEGTLKGQEDLDKKAQYVLTGLIGLVTAILGLTFSQAKNIETHYFVGLLTLAISFGAGAVFACISVYPRTYAHLGVTPATLDVSAWQQLLNGDDKDTLRLSGVRIKEYASAINEHGDVNSKKSLWLKRALIATVIAFPIALGSAAVTFSVAVLLDSSKTAVATPVTARPISPP